MDKKEMIRLEREDIEQKRDFFVVKGNDLVRRAKYDLSLTELKILSFLFSLVKPNDPHGTEYSFKIIDFCKVCGINFEAGINYKMIRSTIQGLRNKSFWILEPNGDNRLVGWLGAAKISPSRGKVTIKFDESIEEYVHNLFSNYTKYELLATLPMQSRYSFRIYELLESYSFKKTQRFELEEFKKLLAAEKYERFPDFRRKVLEPAVREINQYTDIVTSYETETRGRKVIALRFYILKRDRWEYANMRQKINKDLNRQLTIFDFIPEDEGKGEA